MTKTITISVDEGVEQEFRKFAGSRYGKKKGYLGKAITQAMKEWTTKESADIVTEGLKLLKEGIQGKKWKFNRDELHERSSIS